MADDDPQEQEQPPKVDRAILVVLGDVGHSPRMCYHALSLAEHEVDVELVGYVDSKPHEKIANNPRIRTVPVRPPPDAFSSKHFPRPLSLLVKFVWSFFALLNTLLFHTSGSATVLMMQNPPGIPVMLVCYLMARLKGALFVVDWHNYTFSMFSPQGADGSARGSGFKKWLTAFAHAWEGFWGRRADQSVSVSHAMHEDLKRRWGVGAVVLYDKPPEHYRMVVEKFTNADRCALYGRYFPYANWAQWKDVDGECVNEITRGVMEANNLFAQEVDSGKQELRDNRPFLLVSSTSWTEDEDFGMLLDAVEEYERVAKVRANGIVEERLPKLFVVITGKGPLKAFYMERVAKMNLKLRNAHITSAWLAAEDYPRLLASADLGVCLHTSTSGVDLPMKVVDMFGCGLPVIAKRFPAIGELVKDLKDSKSERHQSNGRLFDTASQLREALVELSQGFPNNQALHRMRGTLKDRQVAWSEQWDATLWPLLSPRVLHTTARDFSRWERFASGSDETDSES